jgi:hypothetical protein
VGTRSQVHIVVAPSNIRILGLNPTRDVEVCLVSSVSLLSCGWKSVHSTASIVVNAALNFLLRAAPWNFCSWANIMSQKVSSMSLNVILELFRPCIFIVSLFYLYCIFIVSLLYLYFIFILSLFHLYFIFIVSILYLYCTF